MINRTEFTKRFSMLLDRFGRTMSDPGILEYFEILNTELTTEQFQAAAREIYRHDQFWPSPQRFIDAARGGNEKELADAAWSDLLQTMKSGRPHDAPPAAITTLKRSGATFRDLQEANEHRLGVLERSFKATYVAALKTPGTTTPTLEAPAAAEAANNLARFLGAGDER